MGLLILFHDLFPELGQILHVGQKVFLAFPLGNGPDNKPARGRFGPLDYLLEPFPFHLVFNAPRHPHMINGRHIDEMASRAAKCAK